MFRRALAAGLLLVLSMVTASPEVPVDAFHAALEGGRT